MPSVDEFAAAANQAFDRAPGSGARLDPGGEVEPQGLPPAVLARPAKELPLGLGPLFLVDDSVGDQLVSARCRHGRPE